MGRELKVDDPVAEFGNCFGHIATWSFSFFLIVVSRRSPPFTTTTSSLNYGVRKFHVWPGRVVVVASVIHGTVHMYRWSYRLSFRWWDRIIPYSACWHGSTSVNQYPKQQPVCLDSITGCSCQDIFRNLVGFVALIGMILIGLTSMYSVRRRWFPLFYIAHVVAAPMVTLLMCLHFTRTIVYIAPSILFYAACSFPAWTATIASAVAKLRGGCKAGIRILACQRIVELDKDYTHRCDSLTTIGPSVMSLIVDASEDAMQLYKPGQHVFLYDPALSCLSHPFTVNPVFCGDVDDEIRRHPHQLRILFRETREFTRSLGQQLAAFQQGGGSPLLYMDGYFGSKCRLENALQYNDVVMVAGGIGIVAYLSLIDELIAKLSPIGNAGSTTTTTKKIVLHWMCRELSLIQFIRREYLDKLENTALSLGVAFHVTIHHTGAVTIPSNRYSTSTTTTLDLASMDDDHEQSCTIECSTGTQGENQRGAYFATEAGREPFTPCKFATPSQHPSKAIGRYATICIYGILNGCVGPWVTWYALSNAVKEEDVAATVWMWLCVVVIDASVLLLARTMDVRSFAAFSSVMWSGLFIIWFVYLNIQSEQGRLLARLISPSCIVLIAALVGIIYNRQSKNSTVEYKLLGANDSDETEMVNVEKGRVRRLDDNDVVMIRKRDNLAKSIRVSAISMVDGRPLLEELFSPLVEAAESLGIFACGPAELMQDIRHTVQLLQCRNLKGCLSCIPIYEESFEM